MLLPRSIVVALGAVAVAAAAPAAEKAPPFAPPHWPTQTAPVDWPGNPGTRLTMKDFAAKYPPARRVWKINVTGWSRQLWQAGDMGTYRVGETVQFSAMIGDRDSEFFGSIKHGSDGGRMQATLHWMDPATNKQVEADRSAVRLSCATCSGYWSLYFNVPSKARTGRHRIEMRYTHDKLAVDVRGELFFHVVNDGSWDDSSVLDEAAKKHAAAIVLQDGRPCRLLGIDRYDGTRDTCFISPNAVPDRRLDHCNFGGLTDLRVGQYAMDNRALVAFDLSKVPSGAAVAGAWLQLYLSPRRAGRSADRVGLLAYEVLRPWSPGRGDGDRWGKQPVLPGEASWQCSAHPAKWSKGGCDEPGADRGAEPVGTSGEVRKRNCWVTVPLARELVARWVKDPKSNHGVVLTSGRELGHYHSSEFEDPAMRPRLIVAFSAAPVPAACPDGTCPTPVKP